MKRNVILRVAIAIDTTNEVAQQTAELAAAHVKNCLMDNPNVDETTIEDVDVVIINDGDVPPVPKEPTLYDIELPNGTPAQVRDNPDVYGHKGIDVIVNEEVILSIPMLCAADVACDEEWRGRFVEDFNFLMSEPSRARRDFANFRHDKGHSPLFASVHVQFKGEDHGEDVVIKLQPSTEEEQNGEGDDNQIFFYCQNFGDFVRLMKEDNGEDFVVTNFFHYFDEL